MPDLDQLTLKRSRRIWVDLEKRPVLSIIYSPVNGLIQRVLLVPEAVRPLLRARLLDLELILPHLLPPGRGLEHAVRDHPVVLVAPVPGLPENVLLDGHLGLEYSPRALVLGGEVDHAGLADPQPGVRDLRSHDDQAGVEAAHRVDPRADRLGQVRDGGRRHRSRHYPELLLLRTRTFDHVVNLCVRGALPLAEHGAREVGGELDLEREAVLPACLDALPSGPEVDVDAEQFALGPRVMRRGGAIMVVGPVADLGLLSAVDECGEPYLGRALDRGLGEHRAGERRAREVGALALKDAPEAVDGVPGRWWVEDDHEPSRRGGLVAHDAGAGTTPEQQTRDLPLQNCGGTRAGGGRILCTADKLIEPTKQGRGRRSFLSAQTQSQARAAVPLAGMDEAPETKRGLTQAWLGPR